jgi:hypothetical protein
LREYSRPRKGTLVVRTNGLKLAALLIAAILTLVIVPAALANSAPLTNNNLGISGSLGTATWTQSGSNVNVTVSMNSGYAILLNGGVIGINTRNGVVLGSLTNFSINGLSANLKQNSTIGSFTFNYLYRTSVIGGQQFPTVLSFTIPNAKANQLTGLGTHVCVLGGRGCSATGFDSTGTLTAVPEPGTLGLLGTGLAGVACLVRRRLMAGT